MPLYEYRCRKCGEHTEKIQKFSDPPLKSCEECGGKLERLVSVPAIRFKGSGWYVTDYAKKSVPTESGKTESPSTSKSESSPSDGTKKTKEPPSTKKEKT